MFTNDYGKFNGLGREYLEAQMSGENDKDTKDIEDIEDVREALFYASAGFDLHLENTLRSPWLKSELGRISSHSALDALTMRHHNGEWYVDDRLFENVLQAHNFYLAQASESYRARYESILHDFFTSVQRLINGEVLPLLLSTRLDSLKVAQPTFSIGDGYYDELGRCEAELIDGIEKVDIIVSPTEINDGEIDKMTMFHELTHTLIPCDDRKKLLISALEDALPDPRAAGDVALYLDEAITEHIAQVAVGKRSVYDFDIEEPAVAYPKARSFLKKIASDDEKYIKTLICLHFGEGTVQAPEIVSKMMRDFTMEDIAKSVPLPDYDLMDAAFNIT